VPLTTWSQLRYYDPEIDAEAVRISGFDGRGGEFWRSVPLCAAGKSRLEQRNAVLDEIENAIALADRGLRQPGEV
jgi:hypothetical protein